mmetsp:Transcript_7324/g.16638  ORF Transcript_7324/g.16638 Transcript_7324/m.16638 type:complete len:211 (+) Transcript_7324:464-1096(+)
MLVSNDNSVHATTKPTMQDAIRFIHQIKFVFRQQPEVYTRFEAALVQSTTQPDVDLPAMIRGMYHLLESNESLLLGFNCFLPPGYRIVVLQENNVRLAAYCIPQEPNARYILGQTRQVTTSSTSSSTSDAAAAAAAPPPPPVAPGLPNQQDPVDAVAANPNVLQHPPHANPVLDPQSTSAVWVEDDDEDDDDFDDDDEEDDIEEEEPEQE